jgi:hypothetical protein
MGEVPGWPAGELAYLAVPLKGRTAASDVRSLTTRSTKTTSVLKLEYLPRDAYKGNCWDCVISAKIRDVFNANAGSQAHIEQEVGTAGTAILVFFSVRFPDTGKLANIHRLRCVGLYHRLSARLPTPLQSCAVVNG